MRIHTVMKVNLLLVMSLRVSAFYDQVILASAGLTPETVAFCLPVKCTIMQIDSTQGYSFITRGLNTIPDCSNAITHINLEC